MFTNNLEKITLNNKNYRAVINTTKNMQLVVMSIKPGVEIGTEIHPITSQFIRVEQGSALAILNGEHHLLYDGDYIIIAPKTKHNIINIGNKPLKLYTIYTPPEHNPNLIQKTK